MKNSKETSQPLTDREADRQTRLDSAISNYLGWCKVKDQEGMRECLQQIGRIQREGADVDSSQKGAEA